MYAKVENQTVIKFPYSLKDLKEENPNTSYPLNYDVSKEENVVPVEVSEAPSELHVSQVVFENGSFVQKWVVDGAEYNKHTMQLEIEENLRVLSQTDWIVVKIYESQIKGEDITPLLEKYSQELISRENARQKINSLELGALNE